MNRKIILIVMLLISVGMLSGCLDNEPKVKYKSGRLDEVVHNRLERECNFIFNDDSVFTVNYYGDDVEYYKTFIGKKIEIRYFEQWGNKILDVKTL